MQEIAPDVVDNVYLRHAASLSSGANFRLGFVEQTRRQSRRLLCADGFYSSSLEDRAGFYIEGSVNSFFISQCARTTSGARCSAS